MRPNRLLALAALLVLAAGCRQDMHDQPVVEAYEASDFFADGRGDRMPIEGTVARGQLMADEAYYTGLENDAFVTSLPVAISHDLLERGRERFDIFCSPCHDRAGTGQGMIVRRGFKQPVSFHDARLRAQPVGYFFDVMTRGFGEMSSYAPVISPEDRWAITAYIGALQYSQNAPLSELPASVRNQAEAALTGERGDETGGKAEPEDEHHG